MTQTQTSSPNLTQTQARTQASTSNLTQDGIPINEYKRQTEKIINNANLGIFEEVIVTIETEQKHYSPILNWFTFNKNFAEHPRSNKVDFKCIICHPSVTIVSTPLGKLYMLFFLFLFFLFKFQNIGKPGNLQQHISIHEEGRNWISSFKKYKQSKTNNYRKLDSQSIALVKFFIESNIAMNALSNKHLRSILTVKLKPSRYSFKNVFIPEMMSHLNNALSQKLRNASYIHLITDIWTNINTIDFLGLAVVCVFNDMKKEIFTIGLTPMEGSHCAENVKKAIETIINKLEFNKAKIVSVVCDEGSNLLRLFKANEDFLFAAKKRGLSTIVDFACADDDDDDDEDFEYDGEEEEDETDDDDEDKEDSDDDYDNSSDEEDPEVAETEKELSSDGFFSKVIQTRKRASQDNRERQREAPVFLTEYKQRFFDYRA